jgi:pSer/pThr/pTyr-binding forkhead associated (FHA) protein
MMRLVVEQGKLAGHGFDLERPVIVIGRGQDCDIILDEHQVSRQHVRLQHTPQGWMAIDLGSTNGTQVNGQPLQAHEAYALQPGDRVALGAAMLVLQQPTEGQARPQEVQKRRKPNPALLIASAVVIAAVLVGIVVILVLSLQDKEDKTAPGDGVNPLDQVEELLPIPTLIEGITTALPIPTQLEEIATALPIPTELEGITTALPVPTQLQDLVTALPFEPPKLPMQMLGTPPPPAGVSLSGSAGYASIQGTEQ